MRYAQLTNAGVPGAYAVRRAMIRLANYALLLALAFVFLAPFWFIVVTSFKHDNLAVRDMGSLMGFVPRVATPELPTPAGWNLFRNYQMLGERLFIGRMYLNSVLICASVVVGRLLVDGMAAYSLARLRWKGQGIILAVIISLIIMPFEAYALPLLLTVNAFGWLNSFHVQIVPFIANPLAIFLFYQFFLNFSREIEEAAYIDGSTFFQTYRVLVVPASGPVFATVAILAFLDLWGAFLWPLMVTRGYEFRPAILGLYYFFEQRPLWGQIMAYATLVTIPVLIVFLVFQRWFVQSVARTGLKG